MSGVRYFSLKKRYEHQLEKETKKICYTNFVIQERQPVELGS